MNISNPLPIAVIFIIQSVFVLYSYAVIARIIMQLNRADFYNPFAQLILKFTNPIVLPLRQKIANTGNIDSAAILVLISVTFIKLALVFFIRYGLIPGLLGLFIWCIGDIISLIITFYTYCIIIQIILSWINPGTTSAAVFVIYQMTEPLLAKFRHYIPLVAGLDISPMFALFCLQLISILFAMPIQQLGAMHV